MLLRGIHFAIAIKELLRGSGIFLSTSFVTGSRCTNCGQRRGNLSDLGTKDEESYSLLGGNDRFGNDLEDNAGPDSNSNADRSETNGD